MATVIAEIGCAHIGNIERAKNLARLAAISGANVAKFQKRNPTESTPKELWDKPHPNQLFSYGNTYLEHRQNVELPIEKHAELKTYCESIGIEYATSVWDLTSAKEVIELNPKFIKVPSALNHNYELISYLFERYAGDIHISQGMMSKEERQTFKQFFQNHSSWKNRLVVYHCTSAYPCPFENLYLNEIISLEETFPRVGFSNHGYGIAADISALTLGATYFERHFIDDRTFRHTDAAASLEPDGLSRLCRDLKNVTKAFSYKPESLDKLEQEQRSKLRSPTP